MRSKTLLVVFLVALSLVAWGQDKKKEAEKSLPETVLPEKEEAAPSFELPLPPGQYIYKPEGRRDPFLNPLTPTKGPERKNIEGVGGLMIDELELEGIIKAYGTFRAMLKGPDEKPYVVIVGDKVFDGEVVNIDSNSISFKKVSSINLPGQKDKIVTKTLNPEKED